FSEATTGDAGTLSAGQQITLSAADGWLRSPVEDLAISLLVGGSPTNVTVSYVGNDNESFARGDLNFDGELDAADWAVFSSFSYSPLNGLSLAEAYARGDFNNDGQNDFVDFRIFKQDYIAAHGAAA